MNITPVAPRARKDNCMGLPGLDLGRIFEEGFRTRTDPDDDWHREKPETWHYHASGLSGCPRQQVLRRLGHDTDGVTLSSALTFEVGHAYHRLLERFCGAYEAVEPRFKVLATEAGGTHRVLPLRARCDLLFSWEGELVLADLKTEAPQAASRRRAEMALYGYPAPYRHEHRIQLAAQAMVIESLMMLPEPINQGRALYLNKVNYQVDQVPVAIDQGARELVYLLVQGNEVDFARHEQDGKWLPPRLAAPDEVWRCQPRSETDDRGKWCPCRSYCMSVKDGDDAERA